MKLYHYSNELYPALLTRTKSKSLSDLEIREGKERARKYHLIGSYNDHISLFFDAVPLKLLGRLFDSNHRAWFKGNKLYEYVVETASLPVDILFEVVESPNQVDHLDKVEWVDDERFVIDYFKTLDRLKRQWGEIGVGKAALETQMSRFVGSTQAAYLAARDRKDWEENRSKYAANVPHLMVYPSSGEITIERVNAVTVGSDARTPVKAGVRTLASHRW